MNVERAPAYARGDGGLRRCAAALWARAPGRLTVVLDGRTLRPSGYHVTSPAFGFTMPAHNNGLELPGRTHGRMAVDGITAIIPPLSPGKHRLVTTSGFAHGPSENRTCLITVA